MCIRDRASAASDDSFTGGPVGTANAVGASAHGTGFISTGSIGTDALDTAGTLGAAGRNRAVNLTARRRV